MSSVQCSEGRASSYDELSLYLSEFRVYQARHGDWPCSLLTLVKSRPVLYWLYLTIVAMPAAAAVADASAGLTSISLVVLAITLGSIVVFDALVAYCIDAQQVEHILCWERSRSITKLASRPELRKRFSNLDDRHTRFLRELHHEPLCRDPRRIQMYLDLLHDLR